jgi:hypothetical protein
MKCSYDGYPMESMAELGNEHVEWLCTNPWHPKAPGPCPNCGTRHRPRVAAIARNPKALCSECGAIWQP